MLGLPFLIPLEYGPAFTKKQMPRTNFGGLDWCATPPSLSYPPTMVFVMILLCISRIAEGFGRLLAAMTKIG